MKKIFYFYFLLTTAFLIPLNAQTFEVTGKTKLVDREGETFMSPVWSPDGSMIAFTSAQYNGIWIFNVNDEEIKQITNEQAAGFKMKWSPDSKAILTRVAKYEGMRRYNAVKVFIIETDESQTLTDYRTMMPGLPQWTDAGKKIFMYGRGKSEIFDSGIITATDKKLSSQKIVYLKDDKIAVEDVHANQVKTFEPVEGERVLNLQLSPDGNKVVFEIIGGDMYVMSIDGSGLTNLGAGFRPSWSPDSRYITYMITEDDGHQILSSDIYSININGTEKINLTKTNDILEMNPDWSPDGKTIAYDVLNEGAIYLMEIIK